MAPVLMYFSRNARDGSGAADRGTIILDEIVGLSPVAHGSLRVLWEAEVTRVGASQGRAVDVRVMAEANLGRRGRAQHVVSTDSAIRRAARAQRDRRSPSVSR